MENIKSDITTVSAVACKSYEKELILAKVSESIKLSGGFPPKIKAGSKILIKPNLLTAKSPDCAATTHPEVINALITILKKNGITDITIGDSPAGNHEWDVLWNTTGIQEVARKTGVKLIKFVNFKRVDIGKIKDVPVLKELDDFDAVISVPKFKTHALTMVTGAVKNSYGLVIGGAKSHYHGYFPSPTKMSEFICEVYEKLKVDYILMDAVVCMEGEGPSAGSPREVGVILAGYDAVAVDSCACSIFGYRPEQIKFIAYSQKKGIGIGIQEKIKKTGDGWDVIEKANAKKSVADLLFRIPEKLFFVITLITRCRPRIDQEKCIKCGLCAKACSQNAITVKNGKFKVKHSKCVLCMCCIEACADHAIRLRSSFLWNRGLK